MPETGLVELLDVFLLSNEALDNGMGLSNLDGFLSRLGVEREMIWWR